MSSTQKFVSIILSSVLLFSSLALSRFVLADTASNTVATSTDPNAGVSAAVQSAFSDIPIMIAIAKCESGPRQFKADGTPLLGGTGTMVGVFQIDETIHYNKALSLGYDIMTLAGNLGYARYLYGAEGTEPWISSFGCWGSAAAAATSTPVTVQSSTVLTRDLSLGMIDPQVLVLQQLLNKAGFTLTETGAGSPGNETTKFGALTYAALKKFQCAQGIACSGEEATTGYGFLNAATREALLAISDPEAMTIAEATTTTTTASSTTSTSTAASASSTSVGVADDPAELAELQSRISALVAIVAQLEAQLAARGIAHS